MGEYRKPWKDFASVCGSLDGKHKRWIIDIDNASIDDEIVSSYEQLISSCDSGSKTIVICRIPTKTGVHIITCPFNLKQFKDLCVKEGLAEPDIQKNHITLLFEDLETYVSD